MSATSRAECYLLAARVLGWFTGPAHAFAGWLSLLRMRAFSNASVAMREGE